MDGPKLKPEKILNICTQWAGSPKYTKHKKTKKKDLVKEKRKKDESSYLQVGSGEN